MHVERVVLAGQCLAMGCALAAEPSPGFAHDLATRHPLPSSSAQDVRRLAVSPANHLWAATADGAFVKTSFDAAWARPQCTENLAPAFAVASSPSSSNEVWIGAWNGLFRASPENANRVSEMRGPVAAIVATTNDLVFVGGPDGYFRYDGRTLTALPHPPSFQVSELSIDPDGNLWAATGMGAFRWGQHGAGYVRPPLDDASAVIRSIGWGPDQQRWQAALGGIQVFRDQRLLRVLTAEDGLPSIDVRRVRLGPDGHWWTATARGLAVLMDGAWRVRCGPRWLPDDDARDLVFDPQGTAWIATAKGVGSLARTNLSLASKAARFHDILEARHVRPPGIVEKCRLRVAGDLTTWEPNDDDNDGGYTALAMAMESYRYAVTRDSAALNAARRAFAACEFLQHVTGTPGFLARSVVPRDWTTMHDPNVELSEAEWAEERVRDPRDKRVPIRWRLSSDQRWLWKGDTSSDEITAHCFGYFIFHELAADATDRQRVRAQVCRIVDHIVDHGFVLRDLDGQPTRWGVWAPERLNHDPNWAMERGINSLEILSFLKLAHHVSGDAKYAEHYRRLIEDHGYARNTLLAPNLNPGWRTYIDMELLAFAYPALLSLETRSEWRNLYLQSFERWHKTIRADGNPFFEFLYATHASRRRANLAGARAFLVDTPLDLVRWSVNNALREDVHPVRLPEVENWQTRRLLPASEIGYSRTDQNPWHIQQGEDGLTESDGVFWLLPYWMGRHGKLL
ncbi:MAG: hypothetical protein IT581_20045 [Verrucomicrobiales bacterium]|nr:hypothetical protein [Verrucomicrobiales bacterium]